MPSDDTFLMHLNTLAQRSSWRVCELPAEITGKVLRVLDHRGWVEFRLWELDDRTTPPLQNSRPEDFKPCPMYFGWFSPERDPSAAGDLSLVFARHRNDPKLSTEVRVTSVGKAALDEQCVLDRTRQEEGTTAPSKPDAKQVHIPPRARKAGEQYDKAVEASGKARLIDREAYAFLEDVYRRNNSQGELPRFDAWQSYLRIYRRRTGCQKNTPRRGRDQRARSITTHDAI